MLAAKMKAVEIQNPGPSSRLVLVERAVPKPGPGEVLIKVAAAGVNRPDLLQKQGLYPPPEGASDIPGLEVAGTLEDGTRVCALVTGGGYAQYCIAPVAQCLPVPKGFSMEQAAALPETFFTVWRNLFDIGRLKKGERLLVHGGASGIGTTAIQMAKWVGAHITVTAGSDEKCKACIDLGADAAINYKTQEFTEHAKDMNVILDMIGGDYVPRNLKCLAEEGRHVSIATQRGREATVDIFRVMAKRLILTGSVLRSRPVAEKAEISDNLRKHIWPALESGTIRPVIDGVFSLQDIEKAHARMESSQHFGKIVLRV